VAREEAVSDYDLLREVLAERARQADALGFGPAWDDARTPAQWVAVLCRQAGLALDDGGECGDPTRYRRQLVRTAAVALAALEAFERRGERFGVGEKPLEKVADVSERGPGY
jgi:hypothetical protein